MKIERFAIVVDSCVFPKCDLDDRAPLWHLSGTEISGSDLRRNEATAKLAAGGATIFHSHDGSHVHGASVVVVSDAIPPDNAEMAQARASSIDVVKRAVFLQRLCIGKTSVLVAGTHLLRAPMRNPRPLL